MFAAALGYPPALDAARAERGAALRVCFLEDDAPRAHRQSGRGFDLDVMAAVAAEAGATLAPVWSPSRAGFSEIESTDLPLDRLAGGECDAVASVPGAESLGRRRDRLALTRPYYGAAFELIAAADAPGNLESLAGHRVGVQLQTFAHLAAQALALDWRARPSPGETLELYDAGEVEAALVWGPALAPLGREPHLAWSPPRALRWNEHVAVRDRSSWLETIDRALERIAASGEIERLARAHGIPARAPFATTSDAAALAELKSRQAQERR
ncbi:MAG TPA: transporter substrate-binding domain-containing protein [Thermoanaerobaculia bacterium]|nr:transporter substrate-binding domain-containing protein [Thermoanaerobaculia bacterium]